jgi:CRISPR/Cas system-associated exonuclease Cas4 (RecB family)
MQKTYFVKASEIGDYVFCKRGWWLSKNGWKSVTNEMVQGISGHEDLVNEVNNYSFLKHATQVFIVLMLIFLFLVLYFYFG